MIFDACTLIGLRRHFSQKNGTFLTILDNSSSNFKTLVFAPGSAVVHCYSIPHLDKKWQILTPSNPGLKTRSVRSPPMAAILKKKHNIIIFWTRGIQVSRESEAWRPDIWPSDNCPKISLIQWRHI